MPDLSALDIQRPRLVRAPAATAQPANIQDPRAQALQSFSRDMEAVAGTAQELALRRQTAEDSRFEDEYAFRYGIRAEEIKTEMLNGPEAANPNLVQSLDKRLNDAQSEIMGSLVQERGYDVSPKGRERADEVSRQYRLSAARSAVQEANNQRVSALADSAQQNVQGIAQQAAGTGDLDAALTRVDSVAGSLESVVTPDKLRAFRGAARAQVVEMTIEGHLARKEYDQAQGVIDRYSGFAKVDAGEVQTTIVDQAKAQGVDPAVALGIAWIESKFDPGAANQNSSARGLFQFITSTGKQFGLPSDASTATVEQQAQAGAQLLATNQSRLRIALGTEPTPAELYLAHFLGYGGAMTVLRADADTPASDLLSPGVMAANLNLRGMTAAEVVGWAKRKMQDGMEHAGVSLDGRTITANEAGIPINDVIRLNKRVVSARHDETENITALLRDDIASIRSTGEPVDIDAEKAAKILSPERFQDWRDDREDATTFWDATNDMSGLPQQEIDMRVAALEPQGGDVGFDRAQRLYDDVKKVADATTKLRAEDPALSVAEVPTVQEAIEKFDGSPEKRSESWQRLIGSRLIAQERVGIVPELRLPLTEKEATQFAAPIKAAARNGGDWFAMVEQLAAGFREGLGQYQDEAFRQVTAKLIGGDEEKRLYASNIIQAMLEDQAVPLDDAVKIDKIEDISRAEEASRLFSGEATLESARRAGEETGRLVGQSGVRGATPRISERQFIEPNPFGFGKEPMPQLEMPVPDEGDIEYLRANPQTIEDFISVFGETAVPEELRRGG